MHTEYLAGYSAEALVVLTHHRQWVKVDMMYT